MLFTAAGQSDINGSANWLLPLSSNVYKANSSKLRKEELFTSFEDGENVIKGLLLRRTAMFVGLGVQTPIVGENSTASTNTKSSESVMFVWHLHPRFCRFHDSEDAHSQDEDEDEEKIPVEHHT